MASNLLEVSPCRSACTQESSGCATTRHHHSTLLLNQHVHKAAYLENFVQCSSQAQQEIDDLSHPVSNASSDNRSELGHTLTARCCKAHCQLLPCGVNSIHKSDVAIVHILVIVVGTLQHLVSCPKHLRYAITPSLFAHLSRLWASRIQLLLQCCIQAAGAGRPLPDRRHDLQSARVAKLHALSCVVRQGLVRQGLNCQCSMTAYAIAVGQKRALKLSGTLRQGAGGCRDQPECH